LTCLGTANEGRKKRKGEKEDLLDVVHQKTGMCATAGDPKEKKKKKTKKMQNRRDVILGKIANTVTAAGFCRRRRCDRESEADREKKKGKEGREEDAEQTSAIYSTPIPPLSYLYTPAGAMEGKGRKKKRRAKAWMNPHF